ncbi:MAG: phosphopentomutase [Nitrospirae bacterium]|nr:phosphopentomutase [Nitrospirota bacterium]
MLSRSIIIVLDSLGVGALPDAASYGDAGSDTLGNMARAVGGLSLPNLEALGLGNIGEFQGIAKRPDANGSFGRMAEASAGKDTTTGHWEMMGIRLAHPFPTYPDGFPPEVMDAFTKAVGRGALGNKAASGTEIIAELGAEHMRTGSPIVYTSADSVFQVAAHKDVIPLEELYRICGIAREILTGPHGMGRVIARPFVGEPSAGSAADGGPRQGPTRASLGTAPTGFVRTHERRDFSLPPPEPTLLDLAKDAGYPVIGIGKIGEIFAGRGVTESHHTESNADGMRKTLDAVSRVNSGIIFTNLVEFDMLYGHRNDPAGYYRALREFDDWLPSCIAAMGAGDMLVITADHGCDPTTPSTDHSREYVPLLVYGPALRPGVSLGTRASFSDLGATVAEVLGLRLSRGRSFYGAIA